ncbi:hypothetical protein [Gemmatimonas sp. UBA7669]|uniref:hypothetical protein n=1 Tax=Gemmatimonas sp. UBA7669 TaxID=1946568 RepID=UPI0025B7FAB3|nr:hypothetical protein [Gemmatimonas sp. UBA7669]
MPLALPQVWLDTAMLEEIPVIRWRELFDAIGWPPSLATLRESLTTPDLVQALATEPISDELSQAFEALEMLGSTSGRDALARALEDRHIAPEELPQELGAREFALCVYLRKRTDARLRDVFDRALTQVVEHGRRRPYHEFVGREAPPIPDLASMCVALEDATRAFSELHQLGGHVQARVLEDNNIVIFHITRSHHRRTPVAVLPGTASRSTIAYYPVHGDVLRYDASLGTLRISVRAPSMVEYYRRTLGQLLFGDESFFAGDAVCSLRPLQEHGRALLDQHNVVGIGRVRLVELSWERGDRGFVQIRADDCFAQVEELRLNLSEGTLLQAKLKLDVIGKSTRPTTVIVRAPSRVEVSHRPHESLVDEFLQSIGIVRGATAASPADLWSLYPWRHPIAVWRKLFGRDTDALITANVLRHVRLQAIESQDHPGAGRAIIPHDVGGAQVYGVSTMPEIPSRTLSMTDIDGFELDPELLRLELQSRLSLVGPAARWTSAQRMLDLGVASLGDTRLRLMYALRAPDDASEAALLQTAGGEPSALLIPSPTHAPLSRQAILDSPLPTRATAIRSGLMAAGIFNRVPAVHTAPTGTRLVVDRERGAIWVDGIAIDGLSRDSQPFRFVEHMAAATGPVEMQALVASLSGARDDDTTAARQAKSGAMRAIRSALTAAGRPDPGDIFPTGAVGTYRCILPAHVQ